MSNNQQHFQCTQCGEHFPLSHQHNNLPVCLVCAKEIGLFEMISPVAPARRSGRKQAVRKPATLNVAQLATGKKKEPFIETKMIAGQSFAGYLLGTWIVLSIVIIILAGIGDKNKKITLITLATSNWIERGEMLAADSKQIKEFKQFAQAAQKGNPAAQYWLGCYFYENSEKPSDYQIAARWLQKAAEQDNPAAQYNLALLYQQGMGVEKSTNTAKEWFAKAAGQNHIASQKNLTRINLTSN